MNVGLNLRKYREKAGLTQQELEIKSGVSQQAISGIEAGKRRNPRLDTIQPLARALGVTVAALYGEEETPGERLTRRLALVDELERLEPEAAKKLSQAFAAMPDPQALATLIEQYTAAYDALRSILRDVPEPPPDNQSTTAAGSAAG